MDRGAMSDTKPFTPSGIVTLLTDFGLEDAYVGIVKGVILGINHRAGIVDITHGVVLGDIIHAAIILQHSYRYFPEGTIHLAVVDPGVGTRRRPIIVKTGGHFFVGPDNGIFGKVISGSSRVVHITNRRYFLSEPGSTFHGRDIFAPVAAHLSNGVSYEKMGHFIDDSVPINIPVPRREDGKLVGQILYVDHFGNMITNIRRNDIESLGSESRKRIRIMDVIIEGIADTYANKGKGEPVALFGSTGYMEIAVNMGNACRMFGVEHGEERDIKVIVENV